MDPINKLYPISLNTSLTSNSIPPFNSSISDLPEHPVMTTDGDIDLTPKTLTDPVDPELSRLAMYIAIAQPKFKM